MWQHFRQKAFGNIEKIFFYAQAQSDNNISWPCLLHFSKFCCCHPTFQCLQRKSNGIPPRLYVNDHAVFPKDKRIPGEIQVNVKRLSQFLGVHSSVIMEIRRIINNPRWYYLLAEAYRWYIVTNMYCKKRKLLDQYLLP